MNGMDMMVNAVLKATGFVREDFDKGVATAKSKAVDFEKRFMVMEQNIADIRAALIPPPQIQRAADAQESDHAG